MTYISKGLPSAGNPVVLKRTRQTNTVSVVTMTEVIEVLFSEASTYIPPFNTVHPVFPNLYFQTATEEDNEGLGTCVITRIYAGLADSISSPEIVEPVYTWSGGNDSIPIERSPYFGSAVLKAKSLGLDPLDERGRFVGFPNGCVVADGRSFAGVSQLYSPSGVWTKTYVTSTRPDAFSGAGKKGTPQGPAPSFDDGRTWLVMTPSYRQMGGTYEVTRQWTLSEPGGLSPFYDASSAF